MRVSIARRSGGGVSRLQMSRMPSSDRCSVRGIGVAVIVSTSTVCAQLLQPLLVLDAEALLLVDDDQAEVLELARPCETSRCVPMMMSTPPCATRLTMRFCSPAERKRLMTSTMNGYSASRCAEGAVVLLGEDRRRHEDGDLLAVVDRLERGADGQLGLAVADVAADEAVHRPGLLHVALDLGRWR